METEKARLLVKHESEWIYCHKSAHSRALQRVHRLYGETSSRRNALVEVPNWAIIAATTRHPPITRNVPTVPSVDMLPAIRIMPTPPPICPMPSTSAKPVARARVG